MRIENYFQQIQETIQSCPEGEKGKEGKGCQSNFILYISQEKGSFFISMMPFFNSRQIFFKILGVNTLKVS